MESSLSQSHEGLLSPRAYILGAGNVGSFVAHSLRGVSEQVPITLLLHNEGLLKAWESNGKRIELIADESSTTRRGFDVELAGAVTSQASGSGQKAAMRSDVIETLIVAVKTLHTVSALSVIRDRLTSESTVIFLQNGMGVYEEVCEKLFPNKSTRPYCMLGVVYHGINSNKPFRITHAGIGMIYLGSLSAKSEPASAKYLQQLLSQAAPLNLAIQSMQDILQLQWDKLAVNAVVNPLTATMGCLNGRLLEDDMTHSVDLLISEISAVIQALPDLSENAKVLFLPKRVAQSVRIALTKTAKNTSSMLSDVRAGKPTEIQYINGYIVRRAEELGVPCDHNRRLMDLVLSKQNR